MFLLDANALLRAIYTPDRLTESVRALLADSANRLIVSEATVWELLAKVHRGQVLIAGKSVTSTFALIQELGVELVPITMDDILLSVQLPDVHRDPFDRMLITLARRTGSTIISTDRILSDYGVAVVR